MRYLAPLLLLLICGCSLISRDNSYQDYVDNRLEELDKKFSSEDWISHYYIIDSEKEKKYYRNQIVNELVWVVDLVYSRYERSIYSSRLAFDLTSDIVNLGLSTGAAIAGGAATKSILASISTATQGVRASVDKNMFEDASKTMVIVKMRALRTEKLLEIYSLQELSPSAWTMESALISVQEYYDSGFLLSAIYSISAEASESLSVSSRKLSSFKYGSSLRSGDLHSR